MFDPEAVRAYYQALGIALPDRSGAETPTRCFAEPDAHQHQDRSPSCSVNVLSGAFYCHGCGARGGLYHAALAAGHTPRSAIELMINHGLKDDEPPAERRPRSPLTNPGHAPHGPALTPAQPPYPQPRCSSATRTSHAGRPRLLLAPP